MKGYIKIFSLFVSMLTVCQLYGQQVDSLQENAVDTTDFFITAYNFHPELLTKGKYLFDFNADMPKYFKYFNPMKNLIEKKMSVVVINDAYFNGHLLYGISNKVNLTVNLPFVDSHHYSPLMFQKGVWFGDLQTGLCFGNLLKGKSSLVAETDIILPTGSHKHQMQSIDTGEGAFGFQLKLNGLTPLQNTGANAWQMAYSASYNYMYSIDNIKQGNEAKAYLLLQKPLHTDFGYFGWETGFIFQYNTADKMGEISLPNSNLTQFDLNIGGWYRFLDNFYLRFAVPYTIYQNKAYLTKYSVIMQLDYLFN